MSEKLTDEEMAWVKRHHRLGYSGPSRRKCCLFDLNDWPCATIRLHGELRALRDEVERLRARVEEDNRFCICGCPAEDHESYGEDGESCGDVDHQCLRACPAVVTGFAELRAEVERLKGEREGLVALVGVWNAEPGGIQRYLEELLVSDAQKAEQNRALREALEEYGEHQHPCPGEPCLCGFRAALGESGEEGE